MIPSFVFAENVDDSNVFTDYLNGDTIIITYIKFDPRTNKDILDGNNNPVKETIRLGMINSKDQEPSKE